MSEEVFDIGIRPVDRILGGGIPSGSVIGLVGSPVSDKTDITLRFISRGFELGQPGLYVTFTTVPLTSHLKRLSDKENYRSLFTTDDPLFLNTTELGSLDLILGTIEEGAVGRMVLDRPEVLGIRGTEKWFKGLEDILSKARYMGMATMILGGSGFLDIGDYVADGLMEIERREDGRRSVHLMKWSENEGRRVTESEVGEWTR
jgi:hypothetical protein